MFTFRYSNADCQILHARFVESETPPPASEHQKPEFPEFERVNPEQFPGLPEGFEPVKYSLYQPASRPRSR
jgi:hypothetical protein